METVAMQLHDSEPLSVSLPSREMYGPRVRLEIDLKILVTICLAAAPELTRLEILRQEQTRTGTRQPALERAGVADNDLCRIAGWLMVNGLVTEAELHSSLGVV